jgi:hypothetical protein
MTRQASDNWRAFAERALEGRVRPCPNCDGADSEITAFISPPLAREVTPSATTGSYTPAKNLLVVTCRNCWFVRLFDADLIPRVTV